MYVVHCSEWLAAAKNCSVSCSELIVLNSSSIPPIIGLAWASGEHLQTDL